MKAPIYIDELARSLKPYWIADVQSGVSRIASVSDSGWQSWTISHLADPDPHPQYLTQPEGDALYVPLSRTLTAGNLIQTIGTLGVDRTIAVDPNKLTITGGKLAVTVPSTKTLTLSAPDDTTLTITTSGTLNLGGGSYLGAGFTVQAPASGTMALGAATLSFSSINNFSTSSHSHAITGTQSGASNTFVATTANGDIVAGRDLTAVRYVGGGVSSPTNALHGRDTGSQLRIDDGTNYAVFSVGGSGDLTISLIGSSRFIKSNNVSSAAAFTSGFSGSGWRMDYGVTRSGYASLEVDDLVVRGRMRVYELLIHQIRFGTGSYLFTPGMKVVSVTGTGPYTLVADAETPHGLATDDLIRAQRFTGAGTYQSNMRVTGVPNAYTVTVTLSSGDAPAAGMEFARVGNVTSSSRRGSVYITSDDSGAPYIDVNDGVAAFGDFGSPTKNKVRLGNLSGYSHPFWGTLSGYGIVTQTGYFSNVKIAGNAYVGNGVSLGLAPVLHLPFNTSVASWIPNTNGHLGQKPVSVSSVSGLPGRYGNGSAAFGLASTNLVPNPRFANSTYSTGWATGGANAVASQTNNAFFGTSAMQIVASGTGNRFLRTGTIARNTANPLAVSAWVKAIGPACQLRIGIFNTTLTAASAPASYTTVGNDWTLIYWQASAAALTTATIGSTINVVIQNDADNGLSRTFVVGFVQAEELNEVTPPFDGSMGPGFAWTGTPHASSSTRAAQTSLMYPNQPTASRKGTAMGWFQFLPATSTTNRLLIDTRTASLTAAWRLFTNTGNTLTWRDGAGADILNYAMPALDPNTEYHIAVTWDFDAGSHALYFNGVKVDSAASATAGTPGSVLLGNTTAANLTLNGGISDFAFSDRVLTDDEISSTYYSNAPLTITRSNYEIVLSEAGQGKVVGNAGGLYATDPDGVSTFTLLNSSQTINGEALTAGSMLLGDNTSSTGAANLLYSAATGALQLRNKQTAVITLLSVANAAGHIATFDGVIGITTSGGIWQGSAGTFAAPTTGFKLYTSSSKAIWEAWNTGTKQVYIDPSDMSLRAGAGAVVLSSTGMTLTGGTSSVNQIKWLASGNLIGYSYTSVVSSVNTMALLTSNQNGLGGLISLNAQASGGAFTTLEIDSILGQITASKMLVVTANGIKTTDFGNTPWKLGAYTAGAPAATGYVQVNINGVTYKLLAST